MNDRQKNQMFDIQDTLNDLVINPSKYEKIQAWTNKHGYFIQQAFQNQVDSVVWIGSYNQFFAKKTCIYARCCSTKRSYSTSRCKCTINTRQFVARR